MPMCGTQRHDLARDPSDLKSDSRAVRYRTLALAAGDNVMAKLLHTLADEAERGVLCTADWLKAGVLNKRRAVKQ
jgi:hypothetical protein